MTDTNDGFAKDQIIVSKELSTLLSEVQQLAEESKYQAALDRLLLDQKNIKIPYEQAKINIEALQLEFALSGYETGVQNFKSKPWAEDLKSKVLLHLFYSKSLIHYYEAYSWEIVKREQTATVNPKDLKLLTIHEIFSESLKSLNEIWKLKEKISEFPKSFYSEYISENTYPAGVRDSFRDIFSYLLAEHLNNSTGWTTEEANLTFQLKVKELIINESSNSSSSSSLDLMSTKIHPIQKLSFVLNDLSQWNRKKGNIQASVEAKLTLYQILFDRFSTEEDRDILKESLASFAQQNKDNPWYSMAMGALADFWKQGSSSDALVQAHKYAQLGVKAFPESMGARRCLNIIENITKPGFSLSGMKVDAANKLSLAINYTNINKIYLRSYKYDPNLIVTAYQHYPNLQDYALGQVSTYDHGALNLANYGTPTYQWEVDLPKAKDFKEHRKYLTPPPHTDGHYLTVASMRPDFAVENNIINALFASYGDLVLATHTNQGVTEIETFDGSTGRLLPGVSITVYKKPSDTYPPTLKQAPIKVATEVTNSTGRIEFTGEKADHFYTRYFAIAKQEDHWAMVDFETPPVTSPEVIYDQSLIYTDRSIYRPTQKLLWKTILFRKKELATDEHIVMPNTSGEAIFQDSNGQTIDQIKFVTDQFGAAWGEFLIPQGRMLGDWSLLISSKNALWKGYKKIKVEDYKRPTFEIHWLDQNSIARLNTLSTLVGEAKYYFGRALDKGKVLYRIEKSVVFPIWCQRYDFDYSDFYKPQIISSGVVPIESDGTFKLTFTPIEDPRLKTSTKGITYKYRIVVDVTDEGGETRSAEKIVSVAFASTEAELKKKPNFFLEHSPIEFSLIRSQISGGPAPGVGSWKLSKLKEPSSISMPGQQKLPLSLNEKKQDSFSDDLLSSRWNTKYDWASEIQQWESLPPIHQGDVVTDKTGKSEIQLKGLPAGTYRLIYNSKDKFGVPFQTQSEFFVVNKTYRPHLPAVLLLRNSESRVGETNFIWAPSGLTQQQFMLETYQSGILLQRQILNSDKDSALIEVPVLDSHRGGLAFSLRFINDYQAISLSTNLSVPWDNKEIKIEKISFRDKLKPGQKEKWTFRLTGPKGEKLEHATTQLLAYMYDRSLDYLEPHVSPNFNSIYPNKDQLGVFKFYLSEAMAAGVNYDFHWGGSYFPPRPNYFLFNPRYGFHNPGIQALSIGSNLNLSEQYESQDLGKEGQSERLNKTSRNDIKVLLDKDKDTTANSQLPLNNLNLRSQFAETAFFYPNLMNQDEGVVEFDFIVPDSLTSWSLWLQTFTKDLKSGSAHFQSETFKDLMIRPYLPRFLREGDSASIKVAIHNSTDQILKGTLDFELLDSDDKKNISSLFGLSESSTKDLKFSIPPQGSSSMIFKVVVPNGIGSVNVKVIGKSGDSTDGELNTLTILPGRFHLAQSRTLTLKNLDSKSITFDDLKNKSDSTLINEKLVVQIEAQLFNAIIKSMPYLMNYPYESVDQSLNRLLATGLLNSIYTKYPSIKKVARQASNRKTQFEPFDAPNANLKMSFEETPWIHQSKGGSSEEDFLTDLLDPKNAALGLKASLDIIKKAQTELGGFPWFSGGRPSPDFTLDMLYGFSQALEVGVPIPKSMVQKAWAYMHSYFLSSEFQSYFAGGTHLHFVTYLNYVLSQYPDESWGNNIFSKDDRNKMLNFSFKRWKDHSPYQKGILALTLKRSQRVKDAELVWSSVMDAAIYSEDEGTHLARENKSWLRYNDSIQTHAFALRTEMELGDNATKRNDTKRDGLVQWLFMNKKLNHWKSTRATTEVLFALVQYLKETKRMAQNESLEIKIGEQKPIKMDFLADHYESKKHQIVYEASQVEPNLVPITFKKQTSGFMFASSTWHYSTETMPHEPSGDLLSVTRDFYVRELVGKDYVLKQLKENSSIQVGDELEVQLTINAKHPMEYVHLRDPRGAGFEPVGLSKHNHELGIYWYEEVRDSGTNFFFEHLPQGQYRFKYHVRATHAGTFKVSPAIIQPVYAPDFVSYSNGQQVRVN